MNIINSINLNNNKINSLKFYIINIIKKIKLRKKYFKNKINEIKIFIKF